MAATRTLKPFLLYTVPTANGKKVSCFLEELKVVYPEISYDVQVVDVMKNEQKEPWFIKLNPNGRVPVLVDRNRDDFVVFETAAILLYLQQHYDTDNKLGWNPQTNPDEYSRALQWIFFAHGGVGPMTGQLVWFQRWAPEDIPYAKKRYLDEVKRLYGVLDIGLEGRDWLVGEGKGRLSVADVNVIPWVLAYSYAQIESLDEWPNVKAWVERAKESPGVKAGLNIPPNFASA